MNRFRMAWILTAVMAASVGRSVGQDSRPASGTASASKADPAVQQVVVLSERHYWRKHYTFFPPAFVDAAAKPDPTRPADGIDGLYRTAFAAVPPAGWAGADFDARPWLLGRGRQFVCGDGRAMEYESPDATSAYLRGTDPFHAGVGLLCQRSVFVVDDPARVKALTLQLTYRGGFVAYLNGKEVARAHLPAGDIKPGTPAAVYPLNAFFVDDGKKKRSPLNWYHHRTSKQWPLRERTFGPTDLPAAALRRGRNVLALEFHRSDYPAECRKSGLGFATLGLSLLELKAAVRAGGPPAASSAEPRRAGLKAWTADVTDAISDQTAPNYDQNPTPIRIVAARNGQFSGQVLLACDKPLDGVSGQVWPLRQDKGGGVIPAKAAKIRYGAVNPLWGGAGLDYRQTVLRSDFKVRRATGLGGRLDLLLDAPPAGVSAMPVWMTVTVPKDAPAGTYRGRLTVAVKGAEPIRVPIALSVADWALPDVKDYTSLINIYQSPDTLAEVYQVKCWSAEHWKLIEKSLRLMGRMGNIGLFIPLTAESQMGNPESMVVWRRQPGPATSAPATTAPTTTAPAGATYTYDFSVFDRYVDTAMKYHDRLRFICLNVWGNPDRWNGSQVTVQDAAGKRSKMNLPKCGTDESEALWRPLLHAIRDRLKKRGLDKKIVLGLTSDSTPHWSHVAMFHRILPQAGWARESHYNINAFVRDAKTKATVPVAYNSIVWGGAIPDPARKRMYGWQYNPAHLVMNFNRPGTASVVMLGYPHPWLFRMWMESTLACGRNGNGRCGGDYWRIGKGLVGGRGNSEAVGGSGGTRFGMYLRSGVGQTGLGNSVTDLFGRGPGGPVTTVRLENAREGNQESEARAFIEKALLDKARPLPADLAKTCQAMLDERTNVLRMWRWGASAMAPYGWQERNRRLFAAAAQVRKALAKE